MSETSFDTPPKDYKYDSTMPPDAKGYGFKIIHKEVTKSIPVSKITQTGEKVDVTGHEVSPSIAARDYTTIIEDIDKWIEEKWDNELRLTKWNNNREDEGEEVDLRTGLSTLSEVFSFEAWDKQVRFYNFAQTPLSDRQLKELSNALRSVGQLNGGAIFDHLSFMAILPEDHPLIEGRGANAEGKQNIIFNEIIVSDETELDASQNKETVDDSSLAEVSSSRVKYESGVQSHTRWVYSTLGDLAVHELHHKLNEAKPDTYEVPRKDLEHRVSEYALEKDMEDLPETGTALLKGGEDAMHVGSLHRLAYGNFISATSSGREGPTYVVCRQLDPRELAH